MMLNHPSATRTNRAIAWAAWKKALNSVDCDPKLTWGDSGADSIASLHLLLELERSAGGRSLTFDSIGPDMTVEDLAALLDEPARAQPPAALAVASPLPPVHLFPGLYGDDPRLARFRQAIQPSMSIHLHPLPDLRHSARTLRCVKRSGDAAARGVDERQPHGPVFLAGFSFGGSVAFEAAGALHRAGRSVAFLGLLDTILGKALKRSPLSLSLKAELFKRRMQLALISPDTPRALALQLVDRLSPMFAHRTRRYMAGLFREYALRAWRPDPLDVNTLLAASAEYGPVTEPIWRRLCPQLQVIHLPNGHVQMFEQPAIQVLAPAFEQAVRRADGVALELPGR